MQKVIGIDIGGTKLGLGLGTSDGKILASRRRDNRDTDPAEVLPWITASVKEMLKETNISSADIAAFGISAPFPADAARGIMTCPTNNPRWRNVPILDYLKKELAMDGCFENDANCGALAEWFFGAGRNCSDFIFASKSA